MLGKAAALGLYRAAADCWTTAITHGAGSRTGAAAYEQLLTIIDSLCDDQGGWGQRRVAHGKGAARREAPAQLRPADSA